MTFDDVKCEADQEFELTRDTDGEIDTAFQSSLQLKITI